MNYFEAVYAIEQGKMVIDGNGFIYRRGGDDVFCRRRGEFKWTRLQYDNLRTLTDEESAAIDKGNDCIVSKGGN